MKPQALVVQKMTSGMPSSFAASRVKLITPSEMMHDTGGESQLSFRRRWRKGERQFLEVESQSIGMSWVASSSEGGRPSGMDSKRKFSRVAAEGRALERRRRLWL